MLLVCWDDEVLLMCLLWGFDPKGLVESLGVVLLKPSTQPRFQLGHGAVFSEVESLVFNLASKLVGN
jgi:hypothetical protein